MILDNAGKIMLVIIGSIFAYFYFFKKDTLKQYMADKQAEIEAKIKQK